MDPGEYETIARLEDIHWWHRGMAAQARQVVAELSLGPDARILDAGCGTGGNLLWLAGFGRTAGLDNSPLALEFAAEKTSAPLALGSVSALPFQTGIFRLVTSFEVLYHTGVKDDAEALREFWRAIEPGGWLVLRLPAHNWLRGAHDARVATARRYGLAELRGKLEAAGFQVKHLTPIGLWLLPAAGMARGLQALFGAQQRPASDVRLPPAPVNRLLVTALTLEARFAAGHRLPWGLSLFAIAQKAAVGSRQSADSRRQTADGRREEILRSAQNDRRWTADGWRSFAVLRMTD